MSFFNKTAAPVPDDEVLAAADEIRERRAAEKAEQAGAAALAEAELRALAERQKVIAATTAALSIGALLTKSYTDVEDAVLDLARAAGQRDALQGELRAAQAELRALGAPIPVVDLRFGAAARAAAGAVSEALLRDAGIAAVIGEMRRDPLADAVRLYPRAFSGPRVR
jgi:hypothetical protein